MQSRNSSIGGYLNLEISPRGSIYHNDALALNCGRSAFEHIIISKEYKKIHIPYFTCDVILQPIKKLNIAYSFYHIDEFFNPAIDSYRSTDAVLYTNYFGLNANNVHELSKTYKNIIIDNAQAFFDQALPDVSTFYSPRKFFGLPDGGFVYGASERNGNNYEMDISLDRIMHLLTRIELGAEVGYQLFKDNDANLNNQPIKRMSKLTRALLNGIDYEQALQKRLQNFKYIHQSLKQSNKLADWIDNANITCPMVYPYWIENGAVLRKRLAEHKIYTAMYWPNVLEWVKKDQLEYDFANNIICVPIDQRYDIESMSKIIKVISNE